MKTLLVCLLISLFSLPASAIDKTICSTKNIAAARKKFKSAYDKKDFKGAKASLAEVMEKCYAEEETQSAYCWAKSDYSLVLSKLGEVYECRSLLGSSQDPRDLCSNDDTDDRPFAIAIQTNFDLCEKEIAKREKSYQSVACKLKTTEKLTAAIEIPSKDAKASECLALKPAPVGDGNYYNDLPESEKDNPPVEKVCPKLVKLTADPKAKAGVKMTTIDTSGTTLSEPDDCCMIDSIGVKSNGAALELLLNAGIAHPCSGGGTAMYSPSGIFKLENAKLKLVKSTAWGTH